MNPSIGRIVHYSGFGSMEAEGAQRFTGKCRAAVITAVTDDQRVSLAVLHPGELAFKNDVVIGEAGGTWHWPERV